MTHYIRIIALSDEDFIIAQSKRITVQTSAPPGTCKLSLRAANFQYISVEWTKPPSFGGAQITGIAGPIWVPQAQTYC